jgi:hypothetical protein
MDLVMNKRGWIRMLEATIAIMLVSGVLVMVYSKQINQPDSNDFVYSMQKKILMDVSSRSDLRGAVLKVLSESDYNLASSSQRMASEANYAIVNDYAGTQVPSAYGYVLRICDLGDACELQSATAIDNFRQDADVFVEETIVSAVIADGNGGSTYNPKKVRFFVWEVR